MNATVSVIKFAQEKIETLHLQLKILQKKEQQEQRKGNKKRGKKSKNAFSTPQVSLTLQLKISCTSLINMVYVLFLDGHS